MSWLWLAALAVLPVLDSLYRACLVVASRSWGRRRPERRRPGKVLVLVPARGEGEGVEATLRSVVAASGGCDVRCILVLDGEDPAAEGKARDLGVESVCKRAAGPSKGAVLGWAASHLEQDIRAADAVFVLDVGSVLGERFFPRFGWPRDADGAQAFLSGTGEGAGATAALSERLAQRGEDCGREVLGWSVRLRGTGFALTTEAFLLATQRLVSQIEDLEMSLVLTAGGKRLVMAPEDALVHDVKPQRVSDAARQRARWLAGQLLLPIRRAPAFLGLLVRRPLEGLAFVVELTGRPLSLTVPARLVLAGAIAYFTRAQGPMSLPAIVAAVIALSAVFDLLLVALSGGFRPGSALAMFVSWLRAVVLLPRALVSWMWARR